jgi:nucleoside-diphosphate-sugar epimerase
MARTILILGGAGFIGSNIAERFLHEGWNIIIIDGLLGQTGGKRQNIEPFLNHLLFIKSRIEDVDSLHEIIQKSDIIVDCMAWTAHRHALENPKYDLELNCHSHLSFIEVLKQFPSKKIIYLGSRGQYGNPAPEKIREETPMIPEDVQGIHKLAAESYFRVYSKLYDFDVVSLRIPGCFGKNQPTYGDDLGLIGNFIRDALADRTIEIYGRYRRRSFIYVQDIVEIVYRLVNMPFADFSAYNITGVESSIYDIANTIVKIVGLGNCIVTEIPHGIRVIDIGSAGLNEEKFCQLIGEYPRTNLMDALTATIQYFQENIV